MFDRMTEFHERIAGVARDIERTLMSSSPSIETLNVSRQQMARLITAYQLFVHREIFDPLISCGSDSEARHSRLIKAECIKLAEDYRAYTRSWAVKDVRGDWSTYQPEALDLLARIRKQMRNMSELAASLRMREIDRPRVASASRR